jgi:glycolate oxidase
VDGGFARGTDVVKGIAAGADLVGLGLLGVTKCAELDPSYLRAAPSVTPPHVLSAFPLIEIEDYRY